MQLSVLITGRFKIRVAERFFAVARRTRLIPSTIHCFGLPLFLRREKGLVAPSSASSGNAALPIFFRSLPTRLCLVSLPLRIFFVSFVFFINLFSLEFAFPPFDPLLRQIAGRSDASSCVSPVQTAIPSDFLDCSDWGISTPPVFSFLLKRSDNAVFCFRFEHCRSALLVL